MYVFRITAVNMQPFVLMQGTKGMQMEETATLRWKHKLNHSVHSSICLKHKTLHRVCFSCSSSHYIDSREDEVPLSLHLSIQETLQILNTLKVLQWKHNRDSCIHSPD